VTGEAPRRTPIPLLARNADDLLWLARYIERVENLARILDVTQVFARDAGDQWRMVLRINADERRFLALHAEANALNVAGFYLLDRSNPTSIPAAIARARELARTLRAQISTEMWQQLNVFHNRILALTESDVVPENLPHLCAALKEGCQAHTGITEGTLYRDEGHHFYGIGRQLERADQTTRLLDIGFRQPVDRDAEREVVHWTLMLRAAAGYHAYRRVHPAGFNADEVVISCCSTRRSHARWPSLCSRCTDTSSFSAISTASVARQFRSHAPNSYSKRSAETPSAGIAVWPRSWMRHRGRSLGCMNKLRKRFSSPDRFQAGQQRVRLR
jgi:hypothetical protein